MEAKQALLQVKMADAKTDEIKIDLGNVSYTVSGGENCGSISTNGTSETE